VFINCVPQIELFCNQTTVIVFISYLQVHIDVTWKIYAFSSLKHFVILLCIIVQFVEMYEFIKFTSDDKNFLYYLRSFSGNVLQILSKKFSWVKFVSKHRMTNHLSFLPLYHSYRLSFRVVRDVWCDVIRSTDIYSIVPFWNFVISIWFATFAKQEEKI
jgi:hypothetical protein